MNQEMCKQLRGEDVQGEQAQTATSGKTPSTRPMTYPLKDRHLYRINDKKRRKLGIFLPRSGSVRRFVTTAHAHGSYGLVVVVHRDDDDIHGTAQPEKPVLANVPDFRMASQFRVHSADQPRLRAFLKASLLEYQRKVGPNDLS